MKKWTAPKATVQKFEANEYVAACWSVTCDQVGKDEVSKRSDVTHREAYCGQTGHYFIELDDNGTPVSMTETQTDKLGDLKCTLYTDSSYKTQRSVSTVSTGEYIYWTTSADSRTWHHHGTVSGTSNHS